MLKDSDDVRKSAKEKASRLWGNHDVSRRFKETQRKAAEDAGNEPKAIEPADVIEQEKLIAGETTKLERKFLKEIRALLNEHVEQNTIRYLAYLDHRKKRLLAEKLKRLRAIEAQQQGVSQ
jgi:hypothetical protein